MISIIIPSYNEGKLLKFFENIIVQKSDYEVIIVDSSSNNDIQSLNKNILKKFKKLRVVKSSKGRSIQMNKGANLASGSILLFLHADTLLPSNALLNILKIQKTKYVGGSFYKKFDSKNIFLVLTSFFNNLRLSLFGSFLGDNAIFVKKEVFFSMGGFPSIDLMEDVEFCKRLRKKGAVMVIKSKVITSSRRFIKFGVFRTLLKMQYIRILYFFGVNSKRLRRIYEK